MRESTSSLRNEFRRWVSTVLRLRKSSAAISGFVFRSTTRRATSSSRAVSSSTPCPSTTPGRVRGCRRVDRDSRHRQHPLGGQPGPPPTLHTGSTPLPRQEPNHGLSPTRRAEVKPIKDLDELERVAIELGAWGDAVRFVAATGMRPEEWIPLEHDDIDQGVGTVTIRRTYTEGKGLDEFAGKTAGSIRTIPLSTAALGRPHRPTPATPRLAASLPGSAWRLPQPSELAPPRLAPCARGGRRRAARPKRAPPHLRHLVPPPLRRPLALGQANGHQRRHDRAALRPHARPPRQPQSRHPGRDLGRIWTQIGRNPRPPPTARDPSIPLNQAGDCGEAL